jgi:hypothetical protein
MSRRARLCSASSSRVVLARLVGASCIIVTTLSYAIASIVINRSLGVIQPLGSAAVALGLSSIALTPFAVLAHPVAVPSVQAPLAPRS